MYRLAIVMLTLVGITALAAACAEPLWLRKTRLDFWNLTTLRESQRVEKARGQELRDEAERIQRRIDACDHITAQLLDGRLSLEDGAKKVEQIGLTDPEWFAFILDTHGEATHRDTAARYLIRKVEAVGWMVEYLNDPSQMLHVSVRLNELEAEMRVLKTTTPAEATSLTLVTGK